MIKTDIYKYTYFHKIKQSNFIETHYQLYSKRHIHGNIMNGKINKQVGPNRNAVFQTNLFVLSHVGTKTTDGSH